jgi:NTE family protein
MDYLVGRGSIETSPGYLMLQLATATLSPAQLNPLSISPLSTLLGSLVDFERVRTCTELRLFISATNVRTGKGRTFTRDELDVTKVVASAALPQVFSPVHIDGEAYWDGSFVGNPPLAPLLDQTQARDIVLIQNNPVSRRELPVTMADVNNRVNEIAFNIALVREISAIQHMAAAVDEQDGAQVHQGAVRLHLVSGTEALRDMSLSSKFNTDWTFIRQLHDLGHAAAERWLQESFPRVGVESTLDLAHVYTPEMLAGAPS